MRQYDLTARLRIAVRAPSGVGATSEILCNSSLVPSTQVPFSPRPSPAPHVFEFLQWATEFHQPHWLTTRDAHGQHDGILRAFRLAIGFPALPTKIEALLKSIKPTTWHGSKVSGIDLDSDFVWIDDQPLRVGGRCACKRRNLLSRLIVIDTNKNNDRLLRAIDAINSL